MDKVLVTGGLGYVGSRLVPILLDKKYDVTVFDNRSYADPRLSDIDRRIIWPIAPDSDTSSIDGRYELVIGDVRNQNAVKSAMEGADIIIHLAAISGLSACDFLGEEAHDINVGGTRNVISNLSHGQGLIFASTGSVYGKMDCICNEDSTINPLSLYARSKAEAESIISEKGVIFRFATGFGYSSNLRLELLVNHYVESALKTGEISVYECDARRTFINVLDMSKAIIFAMDNFSEMTGKIFNVGHESLNCTKWQVASTVQRKVEELIGRKIELSRIEGHDQDKRDYEVSYEKLRTVGFKPSVSLDEGIEQLVESMKH